MASNKDMTIAELEAKFMSVSDAQKKMGISTYQYMRQIVVTGRYNLVVVEVLDRKYLSKESVDKAIEIRKHNKEVEK